MPGDNRGQLASLSLVRLFCLPSSQQLLQPDIGPLDEKPCLSTRSLKSLRQQAFGAAAVSAGTKDGGAYHAFVGCHAAAVLVLALVRRLVAGIDNCQYD